MSKTNYSEKLKNPRWQKKRLKIMERDEWRCKNCHSDEKPLNVHHRYYIDNLEPWEYPDESLLTLCEDCHSEERDLVYIEIQKAINILKENFFGYQLEILNSLLGRLTALEVLERLKNG